MAGAFHKGQDVGGIPLSTVAWPGSCPHSGVGMWRSLTGYNSPPGTALQGGGGSAQSPVTRAAECLASHPARWVWWVQMKF